MSDNCDVEASSLGQKKKLEEMGITAKKRLTGVLIFLIVLFSFLIYKYSGDVVEMKYTYQMENNIMEETFHYFDSLYVLQWAVVVMLVSILWMWRKVFGIEGFGPMQGKSESNDPMPKIGTNPASQPLDIGIENINHALDGKKDVEKKEQEITLGSSLTEEKNQQPKRPVEKRNARSVLNLKNGLKLQKGDASISVSKNNDSKEEKGSNNNLILEVEQYGQILKSLFEKYKTIGIEKISQELGLSVKGALNVLHLMPDVYRIDGNGNCSVVSKQESPENVVLNLLFYQYNINGSLRQFRTARINNSNVDAVFLSKNEIYLISLMSVDKVTETNSVCKEMGRLFKVSKKFKIKKTHIVIAFVGKIKADAAKSEKASILNRCSNIAADMQIRFIDPQEIGVFG